LIGNVKDKKVLDPACDKGYNTRIWRVLSRKADRTNETKGEGKTLSLYV
jgi:hypothetical protein